MVLFNKLRGQKLILKHEGGVPPPHLLLLLGSLPWAGLLRKKGHVAELLAFKSDLDETKNIPTEKYGALNFQTSDATNRCHLKETYLLWICRNAEKSSRCDFFQKRRQRC